MTSIRLDHIPTEILQLIFSHFCLHCRGESSPVPELDFGEPSWYSLERRALFSLCLTSRRLCGIAQPILYHEFTPGYACFWPSNSHLWDGRLECFVRTMKERPDLAAFVKWIYIRPELAKLVFNEDSFEPPASVKNSPLAKGWQKNVDLIANLIAQPPNLERCSLQVGVSPVEIIRSSALRATGVSFLPLKTLDITLHSTKWVDHNFLLSLDPCARPIIEISPCLKSLNIHMCTQTWRDPPFPSLSNLKSLHITYSRLSDKSLEWLLSSCSMLHTFVYEAASPPMIPLYGSIHDRPEHFLPSNAVKYLIPCHATLKVLHLDLRRRDRPDIDRYVQPDFSLRGFPVLEHLFLNADELYDPSSAEPPADSQLLVQFLPPSIKSLHLAGDGCASPHLGMGLLNLANAALQGEFPMLKQVRSDAEHKLDDKYAVGAMFAAAGIDFDYDNWPHTDATISGIDMPSPPDSYFRMSLPSDDDSDLDF